MNAERNNGGIYGLHYLSAVELTQTPYGHRANPIVLQIVEFRRALLCRNVVLSLLSLSLSLFSLSACACLLWLRSSLT